MKWTKSPSGLVSVVTLALLVADGLVLTGRAGAQECAVACNLEKVACLRTDRLMKTACKLDCRTNVPPTERGACNRVCRDASAEAKRGCRERHGLCRDMCDLPAALAGPEAPAGCVRACGEDLATCATAIMSDARQCVPGCRTAGDPLACLQACAAGVQERRAGCAADFGTCLTDCGGSPEGPPDIEPAQTAPPPFPVKSGNREYTITSTCKLSPLVKNEVKAGRVEITVMVTPAREADRPKLQSVEDDKVTLVPRNKKGGAGAEPKRKGTVKDVKVGDKSVKALVVTWPDATCEEGEIFDVKFEARDDGVGAKQKFRTVTTTEVRNKGDEQLGVCDCKVPVLDYKHLFHGSLPKEVKLAADGEGKIEFAPRLVAAIALTDVTVEGVVIKEEGDALFVERRKNEFNPDDPDYKKLDILTKGQTIIKGGTLKTDDLKVVNFIMANNKLLKDNPQFFPPGTKPQDVKGSTLELEYVISFKLSKDAKETHTATTGPVTIKLKP